MKCSLLIVELADGELVVEQAHEFAPLDEKGKSVRTTGLIDGRVARYANIVRVNGGACNMPRKWVCNKPSAEPAKRRKE